MAALLAFVSWVGVDPGDPEEDVVVLAVTSQWPSLTVSELVTSSPSTPVADLLTQSPPPASTPATPSPVALGQTATTAPIVTSEPVRAPLGTAVKPAPTATPVPTPSPKPPPLAAADPRLADQLVALLAGERSAIGVPHLDSHAPLALAAQAYAVLLFRDRDPFQLDHYLDGGPLDRAQRNGYTGAVGEVLVTGSNDAGKLMNAWLGSPPHEQILLAAKYRDIGIGCYAGPYVTDDGLTLDVAVCVGLVGYR